MSYINNPDITKEDMAIVDEAAKMITDAKEKFL